MPRSTHQPAPAPSSGRSEDFTFLERCAFFVTNLAGNVLRECTDMSVERKLMGLIRNIAGGFVVFTALGPFCHVCGVYARQVTLSLLQFLPKILWVMLVLACIPIYTVYYICHEFRRRIYLCRTRTDAELHVMLDMMRAGPPPRSDAEILLIISRARTHRPRWTWRIVTGNPLLSRHELERLLDMIAPSHVVSFSPPSQDPPTTPQPRPPSPLRDPSVPHTNARSGSPQRTYPYQSEPAQQKRQWFGTTPHKSSKKGRRQPPPDQSNRDERIRAAQERRRACLAAKAEKEMKDVARKAEMERNLAIGRRINREEWTPRARGRCAAVPSSLTGVPEDKPTVSTLKNWTPLEDLNAPSDDDTQSVKTEDIPLPQTLHGEEQRVKRGFTTYQVQHTLKHGPVKPGNCKKRLVHFPTRKGDPVVVTGEDGEGFAIVTNI